MRSTATLSALALAAAACGPSDGAGNTECQGGFLAGDLVISEILANPTGTDTGNEWFEIYNATGAQVDLTGLVLVASREDGTSAKRHAMAETILGAGEYLVLGGVLPEFAQPHVDYAYGSDLGDLRNGAGRVALTCGVVVVDEVVYTDMADGRAQGFDGARAPDHILNDDRANWCAATSAYDDSGNLGTPGTRNDPCTTVVPDTCLDGGSERAVVSPELGDLVITELMPDPSIAADATGEWFEVYVVNPVDLNGVVFGTTPGDPKLGLGSADCLAVEAGDYLVFARTVEPTTNGGIEGVYHAFGFGLPNGGGGLYVGVGDVVLDQITYTSASAGRSRSLDPGHLDPVANDDTTVWCNATSTYGDGDRGTPGAPNDACPTVTPPDQCMDGGSLRAIVRPQAGELFITEFMADPAAVSDANGEWFELHATAPVDLNGLKVGATADGLTFTASSTLSSADCLSVAAGSYVVLARSTDPLVNGGLPAVTATFGFSLVNSNRGLMLESDGAVIDALLYTSTAAGTACSYDDATDTWCAAVGPYGDGDLGTPALANPACPDPNPSPCATSP